MHAKLLMAVAIFAASVSCNKSEAPAAKKSSTPYPGQNSGYNNGYGSGSGTTSGNFNSGLPVNIDVVSSSGPTLTANIGQQAVWTFTGRSADGSIQSSAVLLNATITPQLPAMIVTGQGTATITISWTPQAQDAQTAATGQISIGATATTNPSANGTGSFRWTLNAGGGLGGLGGLGGGAGGLIGLLPVLLNAFQNGGDIGGVFSSLLNGVGTGGLGGNPGGYYGQGNFGQGGGFGGVGNTGNAGNIYGNFGNGQGGYGQGGYGQGGYGQGGYGQGGYGQGGYGQGGYGQGGYDQGGYDQGSFGQGGNW